MADTAHINDVPMQGKGLYSSHAALQHEAMLKALPLLQQATNTVVTNVNRNLRPLTVVEYGSAHGNNSIQPMVTILDSTPPGDIQLVFSDRPENDFNTLSTTVTTWAEGLDKAKFPHSIFPAMIPRSFYRQVVPSRSADLGFSLAALHHLDHVPKSQDGVDHQALLKRQAHLDLLQFLKLRADEIVPGGSLVLSFVSQSSSGRENYAGLVDACRNAMIDMVKDGTLPGAVAGSFYVPTYNRTLQDVQKVIEEVIPTWIAHEVFEQDCLHPAKKDLELQKSSDDYDSDEASRRYADVVVDWLMAVCAGYFLKAVKVGSDNTFTGEDAEKFLADWVKRTKHFFYKDHRDEDVVCSFIFVRLERV
uniref:Methyltransferase LUC1 n=1 Tax=Fusarium sp. TaxID=29916 RepID=LUC1_FUSSX|nr:RecName: Full=Methyltransferase LUC1; AltName: Full=Lucilactaene biosynthesis cluster protein 1 [Fusarium sp.]BBQ09592.1 methyltransferase [Fusarium sp.]